MRIQNVNQNNYQNKNIQFGNCAHAFVPGGCPRGKEKVCVGYAKRAMMRLEGIAVQKGLSQEGEIVSEHVEGGVELWLVDYGTKLGQRVRDLLKPAEKTAALREALEKNDPEIEKDALEIPIKGLHQHKLKIQFIPMSSDDLRELLKRLNRNRGDA